MITCAFCKISQVADLDEAIERQWEPEAYSSEASDNDIGPICSGCMSHHFHRAADGIPVANRTVTIRKGFFGTSFSIIGDN